MNGDFKSNPRIINKSRGKIKNIIDDYLNHRNPDLYVGEFLDEEGCQLPQFGLGGTGFMLALRQKHDIDGKALISAHKLLHDGIDKSQKDWSDEERKLLKDIWRVPTKAALLALCLEKKKPLNEILKTIFEDGIANDLIKPILDYESVSGDIFVSCYFFQLIYLSDIEIAKSFTVQKNKVLSKLETVLHEEDFSIDRRLYVSTTLCMYDHEKHIVHHRRLLSELYKSDNDWVQAFSTSTPFRGDSSFLDVWFPDGEKGKQNNRYLRIPLGFIALSAIYIAVGSEKAFFRFRPVQQLIQHITESVDGGNQSDRPRKTAYFLFFMYVMLHPEKYFDILPTKWWRRILNNLSYYWNKLTKVGILVVFLVLFGLGRSAFLGFELIQSFLSSSATPSNWMELLTNLSYTTVGILSLTRTVKK